MGLILIGVAVIAWGFMNHLHPWDYLETIVGGFLVGVGLALDTK